MFCSLRAGHFVLFVRINRIGYKCFGSICQFIWKRWARCDPVRPFASIRAFVFFFILQVPFILVSRLGHRRALEMSLELYEEVGFIETTASAFGRFFDSVQRRDLRQHIVGKPEA